jgi:hypothetical protein
MKYGKALALGVLGFFFGDGVAAPDVVSGFPAAAPAAPPPAPFPEFFLRFRLPGLNIYDILLKTLFKKLKAPNLDISSKYGFSQQKSYFLDSIAERGF